MDAVRDQRLAGRRGAHQACRQIDGIAEHRVVLPLGATERPRDDLAVCDPDMGLQRSPGALTQLDKRVMDVERGACGAPGIVVMGTRRAEQRHHRIADMLVDRAAIADDDAVDELGVACHKLVQLFRVERLGQSGETREIGEKNGDLPPVARRCRRCCWRRRRRRCPACRDGSQKLLAMAERCDAEVPQVCVGELGQNGLVYIVLGERASVPSEAQCLQERVDIHSANVTQFTAVGTLRALAVSRQ